MWTEKIQSDGLKNKKFYEEEDFKIPLKATGDKCFIFELRKGRGKRECQKKLE